MEVKGNSDDLFQFRIAVLLLSLSQLGDVTLRDPDLAGTSSEKNCPSFPANVLLVLSFKFKDPPHPY
jgi:hypothetical protein